MLPRNGLHLRLLLLLKLHASLFTSFRNNELFASFRLPCYYYLLCILPWKFPVLFIHGQKTVFMDEDIVKVGTLSFLGLCYVMLSFSFAIVIFSYSSADMAQRLY